MLWKAFFFFSFEKRERGEGYLRLGLRKERGEGSGGPREKGEWVVSGGG